MKCFLHCSYNRLGKKDFWKGEYNCKNNNCNIGKFIGKAVKIDDEIEVTFTFANLESNHEKLKEGLRITREKRLEQQKSLAINGASNVIHFNDLYNQTVNDPSKFKHFLP